MPHPYSALPNDRFWRTSVADRSAFEIEGLWRPRFKIRKRAQIATAGSCFAQHISRALVSRGYKWIDAEPAPQQMTDAARREYQYGVFSFRSGNIYTPRMLQQWITWAAAADEPPEIFWTKDGRYFDPFRPAVEKNGFASKDELFASRQATLMAVRRTIETADYFVFTLGLTEAWQDKDSGYELAVCPGTIAGLFNPEQHTFVNHGFQSSFKSLKSAVQLARRLNRNLKFILTVSPVPLIATASPQHVLTASSLSKSILRTVAGAMVDSSKNVDYFPSYEIITHPAFRGMFFEPNMRSVTQRGVDFVMDSFFKDQVLAFARKVQIEGPYGVVTEQLIDPDAPLPQRATSREEVAEDTSDAILCEEEMLDAFSK